MMNNDYVVNGKANRGAIASAVRFRKLNRAEIEALCADPVVQSVFIGSEYTRKITDKSKWNKEYLNTLHGAYSGCFNCDYLLHLDEVADFVSNAIFKKVIIVGVIIVLVIIAGAIVFKYVLA